MFNARQARDQRRGLRAVAAMAGRREQSHRQSKRIDAGMDLRRQTAARAPDPLRLSPPFAPVASP
jgi:hypothetical protein